MKSIVFNEVVLGNLAFFNDKDAAVCAEFCRVATNFLRQGINTKLYSTAAAKLGVDVDSVKNAVEGIMAVLTEATKMKAKESDLRDSLSLAGLSDELIERMMIGYADITDQLGQELEKSAVLDMMPQYNSLNWRLEVEVASRAARQVHRPVVTLNLATTSTSDGSEKGKVQEHLLQTDTSTLVQITQELENALKEMKSREYRKLASQLSK